jgi:glycosyltransferase involved in cell wall biosynthesis
MSTLHVVMPGGVDDPQRPSGGNTYDRRVCDGLRVRGWTVHEVHLTGDWPLPERAARGRLEAALGELPDRSLVLLDGLVASCSADVLVPESRRLRLVALVHLPVGAEKPEAPAGHQPHLARSAEAAVLRACRAVVATSRWTRAWLRVVYALPPDLVTVVSPGADPTPRALRTSGGGRLLCVGTLSPTKGQDVLVEALGRIPDLDWTCHVVGSTTAHPCFAGHVTRHAADPGFGGRIQLTGPLTGPALAGLAHTADLLVVPSRTETYGMVVTEALARGVPVVASDVGGLPESVGRDGHGHRPGLLVPPCDADSLAGAVRRWLSDAELRGQLREAALRRRADLRTWDASTTSLAGVLSGVAA